MKLRIRIDEMGTKNMRAARHHITAAGEVGASELRGYADLGFSSVAGCGKASLGNCFPKLRMERSPLAVGRVVRVSTYLFLYSYTSNSGFSSPGFYISYATCSL